MTSAPDRLFRAFGDATRLRILNLLGAGETCVGDLVRVLGVPQPTASRHLATLRRAGLVRARRQGRWCFYSLVEPRGGLHARLLDCLAGCLAGVPELQRDAERASALRAAGGCCPVEPADAAAGEARARSRTR